MFFKTVEIKREVKKKIDVIHNGKNIEELIINLIKYSDITLVVAPNSKQDEFINEFNSHKGKNGKMKKSIFEMEEKSVKLGNYVTVHKDEYEMLKKSYVELQKFKKQHNKIVSVEEQKKIKESYKVGVSQREIAKEFKISVATVNKIINDKY